MLENLYTTKMGSSKKTLQKRFMKIRSKSGKLAKMMSVVMTFVLIAALGTATVVMAAVGSDGLEYWGSNEAYYLSGMTFNVNIGSHNIPDWVKKIAGESDIINVIIEKYACRDTQGEITNVTIGKFTGLAEVLTLCNYQSSFDPGKEYMIYFSGANDGLENKFNIQSNDGRYVRITFDIDKNDLMVNPEIEFLTLAENEGLDSSKRTSNIFIPQDVTFIGDFNRDYFNISHCVSSSYLFLPYETDYKNKNVAGIDIAIASADTKAINIKTNIDRNDISDIRATVYNPDYVHIGRLNGIERAGNEYKAKNYNNQITAQVSADGKNISLYAPQKVKGKLLYEGDYSQEELSGQFISGNTYCVELGLYGQNDNLVYRWHEYVTIQ